MNQESTQQNRVIAAFEDSLIRSLRRLGLERASVLLAVSGGADSMALMFGVSRVSERLGLSAQVVTVDHGLRPQSAGDVDFVLRHTKALGLPAHLVKLWLKPGDSGLEAKAREKRYEALHQVRAAQNLSAVLTAHTASDQAETVLMRLARGASLRGSSSIQASRADAVMRPMLFATRAEVIAYLEALGTSWVHDEMNNDPRFTRVQVRQTVLPALEATTPGAARALARFAALAAEDDDQLYGQAALALARARLEKERPGVLDQIALTSLEKPVARRVMALYLMEHCLEIDADLIAEMLTAVATGRDATLPNDRVLSVGGGRVCIKPAPPRNIHGTSSTPHGRRENS